MNTKSLTAPQPQDDSSKIAEILISLRRIYALAETATNEEQLYLIRYEADNGLNAARALSEAAAVA